ncbi:MAG TPA: hypothetical protein VM493_07865 [Vicinamibacterales bacterium]|nr:hypothetical protein [Vicinamibacterales bacterium]
MSKTPNSAGSYVIHGRIGRAVTRGIENAQGMDQSEQAHDDFLMDQYLEDMERERIESRWPAEVHRPVVRTSDDWLEAA